jgi:signal transduction histidine kinase
MKRPVIVPATQVDGALPSAAPPDVGLYALDPQTLGGPTLERLRRRLPDKNAPVHHADELGDSEAHGVILLWVGAAWNAGLKAAKDLPETARRRLILVGGPTGPAHDTEAQRDVATEDVKTFGERVLDAGLLSWWAAPFPDWVLAAARDTVMREPEIARRMDEVFALLEPPEGGGELRLFLAHLLARCRETLGADHAVLLERRPSRSPGERRYDAVVEQDGHLRLSSVESSSSGGLFPWSATAEKAVELGEPLHLPDIIAQDLVERPLRTDVYRGTLALPAGVDAGNEEVGKTSALALFWERPRLLHPRERKFVGLVHRLVRTELRRRTEAMRLERRHLDSMMVLRDVSWDLDSEPSDELKGRVTPFLTQLRDCAPGLLAAAAHVPMRSRATGGNPDPIWVEEPHTTGPRATGRRQDWAALLERGDAPDTATQIAHGQYLTVTPLEPGRPAHVVPDCDRQRLTELAPTLQGALLCVWSSADAAQDAHRMLSGTREDLLLAARMLRRERDRRSLVSLSQALADTRDPWAVLQEMAAVIAACLDADGVKINVLMSRGGKTTVEQLYRTGASSPEDVVWNQLLSESRGLTHRVLHKGAPLFVVHGREPDADPRESECWSPAHGSHMATAIFPILAVYADDRESNPTDDEHVQLLLPLHADRDGVREVVGVLGVWRRHKVPFDRLFDLASLQHFAPHVAAACRRVLTMRAQNAEDTAIRNLAAHLRPLDSSRAAIDKTLEAAGRLSGAACAVLLRVDTQKRAVLVQGRWPKPADATPVWLDTVLAPGWFPLAQEPQDPQDPDGPTAGIFGPLRDHLAQIAPEWETVVEVELPGPSDTPWGLVICLQPVVLGDSRARLGEQAQKAATRAFATTAGHLLRHHVDARAAGFLEALSREAGAQNLTMESLVTLAVDALARELCTDGDRAVAGYAVASTHQRPSHVAPPDCQGLLSVEIRSTSQTAALLRGARPGALRLLDAGHAERHATPRTTAGSNTTSKPDPDDRPANDLNREQLQDTTLALGWDRVGAWMCAPLAHDGRSLGALKIIGRADAPFPLGPDDQALLERVASWMADLGDRLLRTQLRDQLAALTRELTHAWGDELARGLKAGLEEWAARAARPGARVAVIARSRARDMVFMTTYGKGLANDMADLLGLVSARFEGAETSWDPNHVVELYGPHGLQEHRLPLAGAIVPLKVPGTDNLSGHMMLLDSAPIHTKEKHLLLEAARDVSIVLHGELLRQEWSLQSGVFRHAMRAPVQGLTSAAISAIRHLTIGEGETPRSQRLQREVSRHTEAIRLWGDTHKYFVMAQSPERLDPRVSTLSLFEETNACALRYVDRMKQRGQELRFVWPVPTNRGPRVRLDARLFDILLSNLLDNGCKYGFNNRPLVVGLDLLPNISKARLWVENIGRSIPEEAKSAIYKPGVRSSERDTVRSIAGEGIGLYLCRAIAEAHHGSLNHTSTLDPYSTHAGRPGPTTPYAIRFTFTFPHRK